jgi:curved DNA-binding protein CbpA
MLGLSEEADETQIKAAYREKVKRTHPDAGGDADLFKAVTEAMLILVKKQPH